MPVEAHFDSEHHFIHVHRRGALTVEKVQKEGPSLVRLAQTHQCENFLIDYREIIPPSIATLYSLPRTGDEVGYLRGRHRAACLCLPEHEELFHFFETTARNCGHSVRVFADFDTAVHWLCQVSTSEC